jgi:glucose/arabinose dehydrogenase
MDIRALFLMAVLALAPAGGSAQPATDAQTLLTGKAAMGDWRSDAPGVRRRITPADLPAPYATPSAHNGPRVAPQPPLASPRVPRGFRVERLPVELDGPRIVRVAPNGDIFIAETEAGRIRVLRSPEGATRPDRLETFASRLNEPFGLAFYPPGVDPQWLYVADTDFCHFLVHNIVPARPTTPCNSFLWRVQHQSVYQPWPTRATAPVFP